MDGAFVSHVIFWIIGAMTAVAAVASIGAMYSMGRSSYRKD